MYFTICQVPYVVRSLFIVNLRELLRHVLTFENLIQRVLQLMGFLVGLCTEVLSIRIWPFFGICQICDGWAFSNMTKDKHLPRYEPYISFQL